MSGLLEMIVKMYLVRKDIVVFTYCGSGLFDIVIFQKSKVEKVLLADTSDTGTILTIYNCLFKFLYIKRDFSYQ